MRLLVFCLVAAALPSSAQLLLKINDATPVQISADSLAKLPRHSAELNEHGKTAKCDGVLLHDVLVAGGIDFGRVSTESNSPKP